MQNELAKLGRFGEVLTLHGRVLVEGMLILVVGLLLLHWGIKRLRQYLNRVAPDKVPVAIVINILYIVVLVIIISAVLVVLGFDTRNMFRLLIIFSLALIAVIVLFRPYIPTLPFKVGNTIKVGALLGKVEATTVVNTRVKTFDGKTVFIPNSKILNDFVINYHYTPTRRIKINIPIRHFKDVMRTKQLMESVMVEDPRVLLKPARPVVYVLNIVNGCAELGARCWVQNSKYWVARCDIMEKMIFKLDQEKIVIAFRRQVARLYHETALPGDGEQGRWPGEKELEHPADDAIELA